MSALRIIFVAALSCVAGILLGFGVTGVAQRQAQAAYGEPGADLTAAALAQPAGGVPSVGPGGNFVTKVYKEVSPAVVHITNRMEQQGFDIFRGPVTSVAEAVGSGIIVDPAGYILTNYHVIEAGDRQSLSVVLSDQSHYAARIIGSDPSTDLALLKIDAKRDLPTASFGDSNNVEIGEWVVAIGNPRGYDWTVTAGIVSAKNRSGPAWVNQRTNQSGPTITGLLQTDAAINPGNSGGPLLNARGEIIGINERIITSGEGSEGIGLAIPSNTARGVLAELRKNGHVQRSWLGVVVMREITPDFAKQYHFPTQSGLMVGNLVTTSPADKAGLVPFDGNGLNFDIISSVDSKALRTQQDLLDVVRNRKPGDTLKLHLFRVRNARVSEANVNVTLTAVPPQADTSGYI